MWQTWNKYTGIFTPNLSLFPFYHKETSVLTYKTRASLVWFIQKNNNIQSYSWQQLKDGERLFHALCNILSTVSTSVSHLKGALSYTIDKNQLKID